MAEVIKMPRLSDTMTDGVLVKWHKKIGDSISEGDLLADIETDKATMEFESFQEGTLLYIGVQENETASVDAVLAILGEKDEDISSLLDAGSSGSTNNEQEINLESKQDFDKEKNLSIQELNNDIVFDGQKRKNKENKSTFIKISPLARRIAKEKNIDIYTIEGTGDGGRIIKRDLENISHSVYANSVEQVDFGNKEIPITQMRKTIANRLSKSKFTSPHFYLNIEVQMDELIASRKLINSKNDVKISFNDIIVKAVAMAIRKHPNINSSWAEDHIKLHHNVNIGVAVSLDNGLVVPVIKNADQKSFSDISGDTSNFILKSKENKLQPSDWEGNTFTISNLGMFGIDDFTAIINPPDACILAVGAIKERPIVKDGKVIPANIMRLTLSCDHRLVDGVVGSKFLNTLKDMLESPLMMFC